MTAKPLKGYVLACKECSFTVDPDALATEESPEGLREAWFMMASHRTDHEGKAQVEAWKAKHRAQGHRIRETPRLECECGESFVNSLGLP